MNNIERQRNATLPSGKTTENADQETGVPSPNNPAATVRHSPEWQTPWRSRGYLPHFDDKHAIQHIVIHLSDSLPRKTLERLNWELDTLPERRKSNELAVRVQDWLDSGHGCCVLKEYEIATGLKEILLHFNGTRYELREWVIMPNHIHVLIKPTQGWDVSRIVASWKKFSARKIMDWIRANTEHLSTKRQQPNTNQEIGVPIQKDSVAMVRHAPEWQKQYTGFLSHAMKTSVWHREYWDRYMRDANHYDRTVFYIRNNPVKAGLVKSQEQWRWSSAFKENNGKDCT